jgi:hypothetical protein
MLNPSTISAKLLCSLLLILVSVFLGGTSIAGEVCQEPLVELAIQRFRLIGADPNFFISCEKLVERPTEVVVAIAQRATTKEWKDDLGTGPYDLRISIVDINRNQLLATANFSNKFFKDGEGFRGIYVVFLNEPFASGYRSFGIRSWYSTLRFGSEKLNLYTVKGSVVEEVLTDFVTQQFVGLGPRSCDGSDLQELTTGIQVLTSKSNGLKTLLITDTLSIRNFSTFKSDDISNCIGTQRKREIRTFKLKTRAQKYLINEKVNRFPCELC